MVDLSSVPGPPGLSPSEYYGWALFEEGDTYGPNERYTIVRKLGWGMHSSRWLARDTMCAQLVSSQTTLISLYRENRWVALEALTAPVTRVSANGGLLEAKAMEAISREPASPHCTRLLDHFTTAGKRSTREHECFVMPLYGGDVRAFRKSLGAPVPLPVAKRIILHLLRGLEHVHSYGIVHTDLKFDNIFYESMMMDEDIERWLKDNPFCPHDPELSYSTALRIGMSESRHLPVISYVQSLEARFLFGDLGTGKYNI